MTRIAIISDIHGNLHALQAVLRRIAELRIREIVCLGDVVGYGPHPHRCLDLVMEHCRQIIRGNHEDAVVCDAMSQGFNQTALHAILWTRSVLKPHQLEAIRMLPAVAYIGDSVMCIHDSPVPGPSDYIQDPRIAAHAFRGVDGRACLVGHTHVPMIFETSRPRAEDKVLPGDVAAYVLHDGHGLSLLADRRYICNPGSVGQPRDCDPRASFAVLDVKRWTFSLIRQEYDVDAARIATERAGLPAILGERLAVGA